MQKPSDCTGCVLHEYKTKAGQVINLGTGFIKPEGSGDLGVVIVGEGPGHEEVVDSLPFRPQAQAGSKLQQALKLAAIENPRVRRERFLIWNLIACQPPNNALDGTWYCGQAVEHCRRYFKRVMDFRVPGDKQRVVLALGNLPLRMLTEYSGIAAAKESVTALRGYVLRSDYGPLVNSFHPSFVKRGNHKYTPILVRDILKAVAVANGSYKSYWFHKDYKAPDYNEFPSLEDAESFYFQVRSRGNALLTYDIETETSPEVDEDVREEIMHERPKTIQFSLNKGLAINFPWAGEYIKVAKRILRLGNPKAGHNNWFFDDPILGREGVEIAGAVHDCMWMFKSLHPEYDRNLQAVASLYDFPFPWKHLMSERFEYYGCVDVDVLHWILPYLVKEMKKTGTWRGYIEQVYQVHPIMKGASKRGMPVNQERWEKLGGRLKIVEQRIRDKLQELVPDELKNLTPRRKVEETIEIKE